MKHKFIVRVESRLPVHEVLDKYSTIRSAEKYGWKRAPLSSSSNDMIKLDDKVIELTLIEALTHPDPEVRAQAKLIKEEEENK